MPASSKAGVASGAATSSPGGRRGFAPWRSSRHSRDPSQRRKRKRASGGRDGENLPPRWRGWSPRRPVRWVRFSPGGPWRTSSVRRTRRRSGAGATSCTSSESGRAREAETIVRNDGGAGGRRRRQGVRGGERTDLPDGDLPVRRVREEPRVRLLPWGEPHAPRRGGGPRRAGGRDPGRGVLLGHGGDLRGDDPVPFRRPHSLLGRPVRRHVPALREDPQRVRAAVRLRRHGGARGDPPESRPADARPLHRDPHQSDDEDRGPARGGGRGERGGDPHHRGQHVPLPRAPAPPVPGNRRGRPQRDEVPRRAQRPRGRHRGRFGPLPRGEDALRPEGGGRGPLSLGRLAPSPRDQDAAPAGAAGPGERDRPGAVPLLPPLRPEGLLPRRARAPEGSAPRLPGGRAGVDRLLRTGEGARRPPVPLLPFDRAARGEPGRGRVADHPPRDDDPLRHPAGGAGGGWIDTLAGPAVGGSGTRRRPGGGPGAGVAQGGGEVGAGVIPAGNPLPATVPSVRGPPATAPPEAGLQGSFPLSAPTRRGSGPRPSPPRTPPG